MSGDSSRIDLIRDAVTFLRDPKVLSSPLTQRISFLESKGLSSSEIERALHLASAPEFFDAQGEQTTQDERTGAAGSGNETSSGGQVKRSQGFDYNSSGNYGNRSYGYGYGQQQMPRPELPKRDWRDYFIMAVVSGGFMYGLLTLSKKYLLPHLRPPTQSTFLSTSQSLADQNEQLEELLSQLSEQTKGLEERVEKEREDVEKVIEEVKEMVERVGGEETRWRDEMRAIREEVEELKGMVPKLIEKHAQAQSSSLLDLQSDLKSLRTLLQSRRPLTPSSTSNNNGSTVSESANALLAPRPSGTGAGLLAGKPGIPSWQLEASSSEAGTGEDKGKEKEKPEGL